MATTKPFFMVLSWLTEDNALVDTVQLDELRNHVLTSFPTAKMTWAVRNALLNNNTKTNVFAKINSYLASGDEVSISESFPARDYDATSFNSVQLDNINKIFSRFGVYPKCFSSYGIRASQIDYLKTKGIDVCMGQAWSQVDVDLWHGSGGIPYPYYASKRHSLIPAFDAPDNTGVLMLDTNTPDLVGNMDKSVRFTIHPADPLVGSGNAQFITQQYVANEANNDFTLLVMHPEVLWLNQTASMKQSFKDYITWLGVTYPEVKFVTMSQFRTWYSTRYPDNENLKYKFAFTGSGYTQGLTKYGVNITSSTNLRNYWYADKFGRVCVQKNLTTNAYKLIDCLRYRGVPAEPQPSDASKGISLKSGMNWNFDDSSQGYALASVAMTNSWEDAWGLTVLNTAHSKFVQ